MHAFEHDVRRVRGVLRADAASELGGELARMGAQRPFLVTAPGRAPMARDMAAALDTAAGICEGALRGVAPGSVPVVAPA